MFFSYFSQFLVQRFADRLVLWSVCSYLHHMYVEGCIRSQQTEHSTQMQVQLGTQISHTSLYKSLYKLFLLQPNWILKQSIK